MSGNSFGFERAAGLASLAIFVVIAACGTGESGNGGGGAPPPTQLALFVGNLGGSGNSDGMGTTGRFNGPFGVATDSAGNLYVADEWNYTIRKITPAGVVTTLAGSAGVRGSAGGTGTEARFNRPKGVAVDSAGNIYVADTGNSTIRKITPAGHVTTFSGWAQYEGSTDGTDQAKFSFPCGVATDSVGNVYVADTGNSTIRKITPAGVVTTLAGSAGVSGSADGTGTEARFTVPMGIATDSAGNVYVADSGNTNTSRPNGNHTIRKITPAGVVTTLAGSPGVYGSADGTGTQALFFFPMGVATDSAGNVFVADRGNLTIRRITPDGTVTTVAGLAGVKGIADGAGGEARFLGPGGVATDSGGNVYVADDEIPYIPYTYATWPERGATIRKVSPAGVVTTLAGAIGLAGNADGTGAEARFFQPQGVATDIAGTIYVADTGNHTVRKITSAGVVTTLAGSPSVYGSADGLGADARFNFPTGVATDIAGNVYLADSNNFTIRKITPAGVVTTLAGSAGVAGSADGPGVDALFWYTDGIAIDRLGNVYVTDNGPHPLSEYPEHTSKIRKISPAGAVTTLAGGPRGSADGIGATARFWGPMGLAVDRVGNVYVADTGNSTIRKITPAGVVTTLAGTGVYGSADGAGTEARFNVPKGVAVDSAGNIYVADTGNSTIRKITPAGAVSTIVGVAGQTGFTPGTLPGVVSKPRGVSVYGTQLLVTFYNGLAVVTDLPQ